MPPADAQERHSRAEERARITIAPRDGSIIAFSTSFASRSVPGPSPAAQAQYRQDHAGAQARSSNRVAQATARNNSPSRRGEDEKVAGDVAQRHCPGQNHGSAPLIGLIEGGAIGHRGTARRRLARTASRPRVRRHCPLKDRTVQAVPLGQPWQSTGTAPLSGVISCVDYAASSPPRDRVEAAHLARIQSGVSSPTTRSSTTRCVGEQSRRRSLALYRHRSDTLALSSGFCHGDFHCASWCRRRPATFCFRLQIQPSPLEVLDVPRSSRSAAGSVAPQPPGPW